MKIKRYVWDSLVKELDRPEISILLGPRQVGKTFLLKELMQVSKQKKKRVRYYNLEIPSDSLQFNKSEPELFEFLTQDTDIIFIDEFHYLKNAAKIFKAIYDSDRKTKIVVSGSSSIEIHKHIKESLAGRRLVTQIRPLTYSEFSQKFSKKASFQHIFSEYLIYGGLPGLIHVKEKDEKMRMLNDMLATYIQKDIKSLIKEENIRAFNELLYLLADYQGQLVSMNSLSREIGVSTATVSNYLSILEATYVIYPLHSYSKNLSNELKKSKKYYFYDSGIRHSILKDFSLDHRPDIGAIHEGFVCQELLAYKSINSEVRFWRTKQGVEIDFVILKNRRPHVLEVKSNVTGTGLPKAFFTFKDAYPSTQTSTVVTHMENTSEPSNYLDFSKLESFVKKHY